MALLLASFFLISFTGVRLLVHHCMGCEMTEVAFAGSPGDCCHMEQEAETDSCCTENPSPAGISDACSMDPGSECCDILGSGCCDTETIYLKGDFELISERTLIKIETPVAAALVIAVETLADPASDAFAHRTTTFEDPPPRRVGRDFVLYSHQLKTC
jgi:hypothetical protein